MKILATATEVQFSIENIAALSNAWKDFRKDKDDIELLLIKHAKHLVEMLEARQQHPTA